MFRATFPCDRPQIASPGRFPKIQALLRTGGSGFRYMIAPIYRFAEGKQNILHTITAGTQVGAECHREHRYVKTSYCLSEPIAAVESPHSLPACPGSIKYVPYRSSPSFRIAVRKTSPPETERQQILSKASACRYKPKSWPTSSRILNPRSGQNLVSDNRTPRTISMHR